MTVYPVGLSRDLGKGRVMRADVGDADVAVWRDLQGGLHAWHNRCPHRGMRLSHGFVRGDRLACLYHGWQFGKDGGCAYIPAHPELEPPQTIHTQVYSAWEGCGVIWASLQENAQTCGEVKITAPVRSMTFASDVAATERSLKSTPFAQSLPKVLADGSCDLGGRLVRWRINPVGAAETMVHLLCASDADTAQRRQLSRWLEAARRKALTPDKVMA
ncbi:MAG: Rieske (2Fe-2S) protein [Roseobacter sp.]